MRATAAALASALLAGCASTAIDTDRRAIESIGRDRLGSEVRWLDSDTARQAAREAADRVLARPLGGDDAVRLALGHSAALQALLFEGMAGSAAAVQSGRMPNPVFTFERLVRGDADHRELDIGRMLSLSLTDLLLWPARARAAELAREQGRWQLAADVARTATEARQAWVRAVAAQQQLQYFEQVQAAAEASAELARRMQAVGNFSRLQRAREQAFAADAVAQLARAQQNARATREALVRMLGLDDAQAARLRLPERLPDLPKAARSETEVAQAGLDQRIDVALAKARLQAVAREQGLTRVTSLVNGLHLGVMRNSETGEPPQKGFELEVPLPLFDLGDASRTRAQAAYLAALHRTAQVAVDARSQLREQYAAYRTALDLARHYRDEIVPLRKTIADENLLRYNGMLIGVFELLADAREQIATVAQAADAERDFWLADAALQAAMIGAAAGGPAFEAPAAAGAAARPAH